MKPNLNRLKRMLLTLIVSLVAMPAFAASGSPTATLRSKNEAVDSLLRQKVDKDSPEDKKNKEQVKVVASQLLDYEELAKRAMAQHWDELKPAQRTEFVSTFRQMLEKNYVKQLQTNLDYKVEYGDEKVQGEDATVQSIVKVKTKGKSTDAEIVYKMHKVDGTWKVWDIVTDEVSLVRNYKTQFNKIIVENGGGDAGYTKLLDKMKSKLKEST